MNKAHPLHFAGPFAVAVTVAAAVAATVAGLAACAEPPHKAREERGTSKPTAQVKTTLDARPLGGDRWEVRFVATPTEDAVALEMRLDPRNATVASGPTLLQFGATPAGGRRELVAEVRAQGRAALVFGHTGITLGSATRTKSIQVSLGGRGPAVTPAGPPIRAITLPDGTRIAETRP